ncbi:FG-GAP-like repeat-containing protein [Flavobacterium sp.]|uniref:FG-GAP-like repeat-containing protein n=2 Tax=Flavobacterium sp. TaxID=239 RepID=UPI0040473105
MKKILFLVALFLSVTAYSQDQITDPDVITGPGDGTDPIGTPSTGDDEVGNTQGSLSVSATGAAVYNVPIQLPPGIKNIAPSISLNYNSLSGDGYAGFGWHIGGLSKISKVPSNLHHDGVIDPVSFDGLKRFSFDGQRLILKTGVYGIPGSTYETEQFSNVKISYLSNGYGIGHNRYFKVEYPDGSIAYYGYVEGGQNNISYLEFPITKWENPQGLKITYEYYTYASGFVKEYSSLIKSIKYGNDTSQGLNSIEFVYKEKNKQDVYYFLEVEQKRNKVLSAIKITGNGVPFKNYYLTHDLTSSGNERLKSIQETTGDNSKSLKPLTFNYKVNQSSYNQEISYSHRGDYLPNMILGDFTGDSEIESFEKSKLFRLNPDYSVTKTTPTNHWPIPINSIPLTFLNSDLKISNKIGYCASYYDFGFDRTLRIISYNKGNNSLENEYEKVIDQIYGTENQKDYFGVYDQSSSTGTNGYPIGQNSRGGFFSDFNGDRLTDFVTFKIEGGNLLLKFIDLDRRLTTNFTFDTPMKNVGPATYLGGISYNHSGTTKILQGDYDGDGRSDLIVFRGSPYNKIEVYSLNNNLFEKKIDINYNLPGDIFNSGKYPIVLGDYNGDSKTDFLMTWKKKIIYSQGPISHYASELLPNTFKTPDPTKRIAYLSWDMNNDGKSDIVRLESLYETKRMKKCSACSEEDWIKSGIRIDYYEKQGTWKVYNFEKITQDYINNSVPNEPSDDNTFAPLLPTLIKENANQQNLSLLAIGGTKETYDLSDSYYKRVTSYFNFQRHSNDQTLLISIDQGNGVINEVIYDNLKDGNGTYTTSNDLLEYPYFNLLNGKENKVVSEIRHFYSGSPVKKKQFKYYGAVFDIVGRGINGFQATTSTNWFTDVSGVISTVSKYDFTKNGANTETFSKAGLVEPNYNLLSTDSYVSRNLVTYNNEDTAYTNPLLPNKVFKLFKTKTESFNGLENTSSLTSVIYNGNNNPLSTTTSIKNGTTTEQKTVSTYGYDASSNSPYLLDRLNSKTTTTTLLSSGDVSSTEELYTYDVNLLKTIKKRSTNSGLTSDYITETNTYDAYGNITQKNIATPGLADRVTKFEYDTATHRFITKKTGIDLLATEYTYNQSTGLVTSELLPSNLNYPLITTFNYDKWGKKIEEIDYLGKKRIYNYSYSGNGVLINISGDDGSGTEINHDKLGRKIHEATKTIDGVWSVVATTYNINDQPIKVTQPYLDGGNYNAWNEMEYDLYGRLKRLNQLKTTGSSGKVITYDYNGLTTTEYDGQKTKTTVKNALGNVISLEETPGVQIQYEYFANGALKATHTSGATTAITQDAWGRRKSLDDPSAGVHKYAYNGFGELLSEEVVGRGKTEYDLDDYGKVLEKRIKEGTNLVSKITYTYDPPNTRQLKKIHFDDYANGSFTIYNYGYDNFKRLNFKDESGFQAYYQQAIQYDAFGRPENELYSAVNTSDLKRSDKWVKNVYKNGSLWKIHDMPSFGVLGTVLWQANTVNPSGQITEALLGNGIKLTKTYDDQGLPTKIKYDKSSLNILTLDTEFDPIYGNLKKRSTNLFGAWTEDLTYDALRSTDKLERWYRCSESVV